MFKYEFFEVVKPIKNLPWKKFEFLRGYKTSNGYVLGGYNIGETRKKELIKLGHIKRVSKSYVIQILINRHTIG